MEVQIVIWLSVHTIALMWVPICAAVYFAMNFCDSVLLEHINLVSLLHPPHLDCQRRCSIMFVLIDVLHVQCHMC